MQVLYLMDMRGQSMEEAVHAYCSSLASDEAEPIEGIGDFARELIEGTTGDREAIDALITAHAQNWRIERMAAVDRNILRVATYELKHTKTPPPVVIDQAIEMASKFSEPESIKFINGVLDAVRLELAAS
jgi:N utilization substance protein B